MWVLSVFGICNAVGATNGHMAASSPRHRSMGYAQGHQPHAHSPMSQQSHHQPPPPPPGQNTKATGEESRLWFCCLCIQKGT